ncbi:MAG: DUF4296 domain-containing protein [Bacteroidetes bacterium]|nr:DUF4296 domain-containing protein [Bacteroidota bacterium]
MKKFILGFILIIAISCESLSDKPKNLISKKVMTEILVDLAMNNQASFINPSSNLEAGTRYILQQHKIKGKDFIDSYQYYIINNQINDIYDDAQEIILDKDPKSKQYILDKLKVEKNNDTKIEPLK